jgi:hypothetical protein
MQVLAEVTSKSHYHGFRLGWATFACLIVQLSFAVALICIVCFLDDEGTRCCCFTQRKFGSKVSVKYRAAQQRVVNKVRRKKSAPKPADNTMGMTDDKAEPDQPLTGQTGTDPATVHGGDDV